MTAVDLDALDKLRGALRDGIARTLCHQDQSNPVDPYVPWEHAGADRKIRHLDQADAVLATPEVEALIAEARKYRALREAVETAQLDSPGDLLPGDVVQAVEWDDATEYTVTVTRAVVATVDGGEQ